MRAATIALCLATLAFVPPKRDINVEIAGTYDANGRHPDGSTYQGKATINRLSSDRYEIFFHMPSGVFRALCIRVRDVLGCGWGAPSGEITVGMWTAGAGITTSDTSTAVSAVSGNHVLVSPYSGAVQRVTWNTSPALVGWGLFVDPYIVAGFPAFRAGAAFYRIGQNGTTLVGDWMDPNMPDAGVGTETLTR